MHRQSAYALNWSQLAYLAIFLLAFIPRALALDAFVAPDEGKWIYRSAHFLRALQNGDFARASSVAATPEVEVLAPAVPTMWTGAAGLLAKYWVEGVWQEQSLVDYLNAIPAATERIPLGFYPWSRFPTVLLTSLAVLLIYHLLLKLIDPATALLAAALIALDPFFLGLSRVIHHDALVSIFIVVSLLALLLYRRSLGTVPKPPLLVSAVWLVLAGLAGGLALLTKPTALYLVVFVALFLLFAEGWPRTWSDWKRIGLEGLAWVGVAAITFVVVWPAMWAAPVETLTAQWGRSVSATADNNNYALIPAAGTPLPELGFLFYPVNWLFKSTLPELIGLIALAVGLARGWLGSRPGAVDHERRTTRWLAIFVLLFWLLLWPADTRDIRYFLPGALGLYILAAAGVITMLKQLGWRTAQGVGVLLAVQLGLVVLYFPYFVDYLNPVVGGPWLAPRLVKIGSGEGLDQMGRYLSAKPGAAELTAATSFWESFVPFFPGHYTKPHYDDEADYIIIYLRQIQNRNPFPEYWSYFSAQTPEYQVSLAGLEYAWLYPGPQLRVVREAEFGDGLALRGYRLDRWAAQPGQPAELSLVWSSLTPALTVKPVVIRLLDETGRSWTESRGPVLSPSGPSPVEGHYTLDIPAQMPRGDYELWVEIEAESHQAGLVPVRHLDKPPVQFSASSNLGNLITFGGAEISHLKALPSGQSIDITLLWQANHTISGSYTTFVHLVDQAGQIWGQADRIPADGAWPTESWDKGEWIIDTFQLNLNADPPPGDYSLLVGVYDSQTHKRLPVIGQDDDKTVVEITKLAVSTD